MQAYNGVGNQPKQMHEHPQSPRNQVPQSRLLVCTTCDGQGSAFARCHAEGLSAAEVLAGGLVSYHQCRAGVRLMLNSFEKLLQKNGKQLPGKKGISLPQEQFLKLEQHAQELTEALRDQNDSFSVALSNK